MNRRQAKNLKLGDFVYFKQEATSFKSAIKSSLNEKTYIKSDHKVYFFMPKNSILVFVGPIDFYHVAVLYNCKLLAIHLNRIEPTAIRKI